MVGIGGALSRIDIERDDFLPTDDIIEDNDILPLDNTLADSPAMISSNKSDLEPTKACSICSKIIPAKLLSIHTSYCGAKEGGSSSSSSGNDVSKSSPSSVNDISESSPSSANDVSESAQSSVHDASASSLLKSLPTFSLEDRVSMLRKFEVLLLSPDQVKEFQENFDARNFSFEESLFQSWLLLKFDTIPTEKEALKIVLNKHTAKNVPKKKTARQIKKPNGPARFDFSSPEFINILEEKENKKNESFMDLDKKGRDRRQRRL